MQPTMHLQRQRGYLFFYIKCKTWLTDRDIFIFDGGNKRLRNVTNLYCQCQISQRRS
jgi:hypothetical protein